MQHKIRSIHFIGIGGAGMSGLAEVMHQMGYLVTGSDTQEQATLLHLRAQGIAVRIGHTVEAIAEVDCAVYSSAIKGDNIERVAAVQRGIPVIPRAQMLGELMRFKSGIAVSGTHGKTTVSSLIATILRTAGMAPTCVIGGRLLTSGKKPLLGDGPYVVVEADESDASFLHLQPVIAVVTNIDNDHLEAFSDDPTILSEAFVNFLGNLPFYGTAVLCIDDEQTRMIATKMQTSRRITYGLDQSADVYADNIRTEEQGMSFDLKAGDRCDRVFLKALGKHNVQNALAACAVSIELGVEQQYIAQGLAKFAGVGRRLECYGRTMVGQSQVLLMDDYAHHPTEITATIKALRSAHSDKRMVVVFQPHRYTRTRRLLTAFVDSLALSDVLVLTDVYAAGEAAPADNLAAVLFAAIPDQVNKTWCPDVHDLPQHLVGIVKTGDLLVTMGAGNINALAGQLKKATHV